MGLNDAAEMLEVAKAHAVQLEHDLDLAHTDLDREQTARLDLQRQLDDASETIADQARRLQESAGTILQAGEQLAILWRYQQEVDDIIERVRAICREQRPWDEADADSAEARSARAYNSALANVISIIGAQPVPSSDEHDRHA